MILYELIEEKHNNATIGYYTSFGINAVDSLSGKNCVYIEDVFTDFKTAEKYITLFNEEQLDLIHLEEAIEDILHMYRL